MKFSLRIKVIIFGLLILLNLILRYPSVPHELGADSFGVHVAANTITRFGYAKWWIHPISILGSYPYSMQSPVAFLLSGISQGLGISVQSAMLLYSMILGVFGTFCAYILAGVLWDDDLYRFYVAFLFSTAQGILVFSTWTGHSRTLFVLTLPLFMYLLVKTRISIVRFCFLSALYTFLLVLTHHYIYFTIPIILSFIGLSVLYKFKDIKFAKSIKFSEEFIIYALFAGFILMLIIPFFNRSLMYAEGSSGRYAHIILMIQSYSRYFGVPIIFAIGGIVYLILKPKKEFNEYFILLSFIGMTPLLYIITYMKWFILFLLPVIGALGLMNLTNLHVNKKVLNTYIIVFLLISIAFTGYFQFIHFSNDSDPEKRYLEESTYKAALWGKDNIDSEKNMIYGSYVSNRFPAISEIPTLSGLEATDLSYGFVDPDSIEVIQVYPPTSVGFYYQDPYRLVNDSGTDWSYHMILRSDVNVKGSWAQRLIQKYNISYFADDTEFYNAFSQSVQLSKNRLYDNGEIWVWDLQN